MAAVANDQANNNHLHPSPDDRDLSEVLQEQLVFDDVADQDPDVGGVSNLWVFGYGSLIWKPGFAFDEHLIGYVKGYSRRFYQGNDIQRGQPDKLGRVVTLIEEEEAITWGRAFQLKDAHTARQYLDHRESSLGGYSTFITHFYPRDPREEPFPVLVYVALPTNPLYLGHSAPDLMARQIAEAQGDCGHNVEYLARLTAFMRLEVPDVLDHHLEELDQLARHYLAETNPQLLYHFQVAYEDPGTLFERRSISYAKSGRSDSESSIDDPAIRHLLEVAQAVGGAVELTTDTGSSGSSSPVPQFADMVTTRKSRCLNI